MTEFDEHEQAYVDRAQQRCGTCEHTHIAGLGCASCECETFTTHPDDAARYRARQAAEVRERGGREPIMDVDMAEGVNELLRVFERQNHEHLGWGNPPALAAVQAIAAEDKPDGKREPASLYIKPLVIPDHLWSKVAPINALRRIADMAYEVPHMFDTLRMLAGLPPSEPVIAWVFAFEASVRCVGGAKDGEIDTSRIVSAVDLDERFYQIARLRDADIIDDIGVRTSREFRTAAADIFGALGLTGDADGPDDALPDTHRSLLRLIRYTTGEIETRSVVSEASP